MTHAPAPARPDRALSAPDPLDRVSRIPAVDVLRGLALGGIVVVNVLLFKASPSFEHLAATAIDGTVDRVAAVLVKVLAEGKFIGLFSLLFGFGVATQVGRWQAQGLPWRRLYARRMAALGVIGAAHLFLVWYGDILTTYAVVSVVLALFVNRTARTQLRWALGILGTLSAIGLGGLALLAIRWLTGSSALAAAERSAGDSDAAEVPRLDEIYRNGGYLELVQERLTKPGGLIFGLTFSLVVLAMMLLGMYVARAGLLADVAAHRARFVATARIGIGVGLPLNILVVIVQSTGGLFTVLAAQILLMALAAPLLALGLGAAVVLLSERRTLRALSAAGRLALTNYLLQSLVLTFVMYSYGLGLYGELGVAVGVAIALALYLTQLVAAVWWDSRVGAGPVELIWRRATYGWRRSSAS
ncbi:DUF418 domain-containing protein [Nocardioides bizhenqiangii]|uniref:DUF418 domain-containing protein n=1 Tax=Nocardioides bizhenqiangii TaxID=3095076 RepID=A0ABZ0ZQR8_9ACTN|nr:DUF418 domain-containing protein [Nocardioides sp. HM61]WQQ26665.1 DUF418 domain-containing protein [Nocardioides sp. HM61]